MAAGIVVSAILTLPLAGNAFAGGARNCSEFGSQTEAQKALDDKTGNKGLLDPDGDGVACKTSTSDDKSDKNDDKDKDDKKSDDDKDADSDKDKSDKSDKSDKHKDDDGQVSVKPKGSVDTGDGSSSGSGQPPAALVLIGAALLGTGAVAAGRGARSSR